MFLSTFLRDEEREQFLAKKSFAQQLKELIYNNSKLTTISLTKENYEKFKRLG